MPIIYKHFLFFVCATAIFAICLHSIVENKARHAPLPDLAGKLSCSQNPAAGCILKK